MYPLVISKVLGENQYYQTGNSQEEQKYQDMQRKRYEAELQKQQEKMREQMENNMRQQYQNAYYNYLRSLGYKIKEKWTWQKTKSLLLTILIMAVIIAILWILPPTHDMMIDFYESNGIIKFIVDVIGGIIIAFFQTIGNVFQSLFQK